MNSNRSKLMSILLVGAAMLTVGCIVSGTFVLNVKITDAELQKHGNSYYTAVDLTEEDVWKDHSDEIDDVEAVGFELWVSNTGTETTFNLYVDNISNPVWLTPGGIDSNTTCVVRDLVVPDGGRHVTYGESLSLLTRVEILKAVAKKGEFNFYATWTEATNIVIDSVRVVVTISAG